MPRVGVRLGMGRVRGNSREMHLQNILLSIDPIICSLSSLCLFRKTNQSRITDPSTLEL